jgi:hypothetical protein
MTENRYVFDNAVTAETDVRFSGLEATFDPSTIRYLTGVGVTEGWVCWEIGAGGGSIARWLAERVGPAGSVLATDIDPRFIPASQLGQLEVVHHDVTTDEIPAARYDLIQAICRSVVKSWSGWYGRCGQAAGWSSRTFPALSSGALSPSALPTRGTGRSMGRWANS